MSKDQDHSPVSLPPASYDFQKLAKGLDHSASLKTDDGRQAAVDKALEEASDGRVTPGGFDQGTRPDQKRIEVTREDLGVTEKVRVFDPSSDAAAEEIEEAEEAAEIEEARADNAPVTRAAAGKGSK